jgi:hypothetical protein
LVDFFLFLSKSEDFRGLLSIFWGREGEMVWFGKLSCVGEGEALDTSGSFVAVAFLLGAYKSTIEEYDALPVASESLDADILTFWTGGLGMTT